MLRYISPLPLGGIAGNHRDRRRDFERGYYAQTEVVVLGD